MGGALGKKAAASKRTAARASSLDVTLRDAEQVQKVVRELLEHTLKEGDVLSTNAVPKLIADLLAGKVGADDLPAEVDDLSTRVRSKEGRVKVLRALRSNLDRFIAELRQGQDELNELEETMKQLTKEIATTRDQGRELSDRLDKAKEEREALVTRIHGAAKPPPAEI